MDLFFFYVGDVSPIRAGGLGHSSGQAGLECKSAAKRSFCSDGKSYALRALLLHSSPPSGRNDDQGRAGDMVEQPLLEEAGQIFDGVFALP